MTKYNRYRMFTEKEEKELKTDISCNIA